MVTVLGKSIFYHIPKTGGSWINEGIGAYAKKHEFVRPTELAHASPEVYSPHDLFSWTVIRHPISWLKSNFSYRTLQNDWGIYGPYASADPDEFIYKLYDKEPNFVTRFFKPFLTVRYVALNENMEEDLRNIFDICGVEMDRDNFFNRKRVNVSKSSAVNFKDETIERIINEEKWLLVNYYYNGGNYEI